MNKEFIAEIYGGEYLDIVITALRCAAQGISDDDLSDCVGEVYIAALQDENLDKNPNIRGWLYNAAQRVAERHKVRSAKQGKRRPHDFAKIAEPVCLVETVERKEADRETLAFLYENLKYNEYKLCKMKFVDNFSNSEISNIIGVKKRTVDVQITRLKEKLKTFLTS